MALLVASKAAPPTTRRSSQPTGEPDEALTDDKQRPMQARGAIGDERRRFWGMVCDTPTGRPAQLAQAPSLRGRGQPRDASAKAIAAAPIPRTQLRRPHDPRRRRRNPHAKVLSQSPRNGTAACSSKRPRFAQTLSRSSRR